VTNLKTAILLLGLLGTSLFSLAAQELSLNQKIVRFCEERIGQKVGDGECFALASQALREAGATRRFADSPNKGDYVWGTLILQVAAGESGPVFSGHAENIAPGDILQIRDAFFKRKKAFEKFGHHTAVVWRASGGGRDLEILQENFGGKKLVTKGTVHLDDLKKGWVRVYRPVLKTKNAR
jgi:hypothetical protein